MNKRMNRSEKAMTIGCRVYVICVRVGECSYNRHRRHHRHRHDHRMYIVQLVNRLNEIHSQSNVNRARFTYTENT